MNKILVTIISVGLLTSCSNIVDYFPEKFDGNEYMKLAELSVLSCMGTDCNDNIVKSMRYNSAVLMKYSEGTLKENIADIYAGIHAETVQLTERENPSAAYCKIKRKNISSLVQQAMDTFGDRKK
jgi:hypothetical protein